VARELSQCSLALPAELVCDNGPEFTSKAMFHWGQEHGVALCFIQPGKPTQNAFVESFNGKFRENCLDQRWFKDLAEALQVIEAWRIHYNTIRPHSSLGHLPPTSYAHQAA
jgi:putative transposase